MKRLCKCGCDVICFNGILFVFVEIMQQPKLGAVRQLRFNCVTCMLGMLAEVYTVKCTRLS